MEDEDNVEDIGNTRAASAKEKLKRLNHAVIL